MAALFGTSRSTRDAAGANTSAASVHPAADRFVVPAYITAAIFIITAVMDITTIAMPMNPSAVVWRFGTVGAASNYMMTLFFGVALACWAAMYYGHRTMLRILAVFSVLVAITLLVLMGDFGLSVAQLRGSVPSTERSAFTIGTIKAALKYGMSIVGFVALASACWKSAKKRRV